MLGPDHHRQFRPFLFRPPLRRDLDAPLLIHPMPVSSNCNKSATESRLHMLFTRFPKRAISPTTTHYNPLYPTHCQQKSRKKPGFIQKLFTIHSRKLRIVRSPPPLRLGSPPMRTADFHFESAARTDRAAARARARDGSRLLVLDRDGGASSTGSFPICRIFFSAGDVLVLNNSRVIPARLHGVNAKTGGQFEILLLEENAQNDWWAMMRPGKRAQRRDANPIAVENRRADKNCCDGLCGE